MSTCAYNLPNPGNVNCPVVIGEIKRFLFVSYKDASGAENKISVSDAAAIANWQTLFDKYNFSSDKLTKVVPSTLIFEAAPEQGDPEVFDTAGYYKKTKEGDYNWNFMLNDVDPYYVKQMKLMERNNLAVFMVDTNNKVWGKKSGTDLYPIRLQNINVRNFNPPAYQSISQEQVTFRLYDPEDMNDLYGVTVADGDVYDDGDFYSLVNATGTVSSPAVTGCQVVIATDAESVAVTGIVYGEITFRDQADSSTATLAASGSLTESPDGTYVINEAALLTTGHTYTLEISHSGYDITCGDVVVP